MQGNAELDERIRRALKIGAFEPNSITKIKAKLKSMFNTKGGVSDFMGTRIPAVDKIIEQNMELDQIIDTMLTKRRACRSFWKSAGNVIYTAIAIATLLALMFDRSR
jgi:hypothetical protein